MKEAILDLPDGARQVVLVLGKEEAAKNNSPTAAEYRWLATRCNVSLVTARRWVTQAVRHQVVEIVEEGGGMMKDGTRPRTLFGLTDKGREVLGGKG